MINLLFAVMLFGLAVFIYNISNGLEDKRSRHVFFFEIFAGVLNLGVGLYLLS